MKIRPSAVLASLVVLSSASCLRTRPDTSDPVPRLSNTINEAGWRLRAASDTADHGGDEWVRYRVVVINPALGPRVMSYGCEALRLRLQLAHAAGLGATPERVWDQAAWLRSQATICRAFEIRMRVGPGDSVVVQDSFPSVRVRGDSLPSGRYTVTLRVRFEGLHAELPAAAVLVR